HVGLQLRGETGMLVRAVQHAGTQARVASGGLEQLLHGMLPFHQIVTGLFAEFLLVQLAHLLDLHARLRATASATRMPSTPAERMPPAYPAPSPQGYSPRVFRLCSDWASRVMRTGEEVRVSTPVSTASARSK